MEPQSVNGSCLCGQITFAVTRPFLFFQYCHCSRCQKISGSAHASNIAADPDASEAAYAQVVVLAEERLVLLDRQSLMYVARCILSDADILGHRPQLAVPELGAAAFEDGEAVGA